jgi:hypothetical protein
MKKLFAAVVLVGMFIIAVPVVASAAPNANASHVANCATQMGGQHVAACAKAMDRGVSECAQMSGPCDMH